MLTRMGCLETGPLRNSENCTRNVLVWMWTAAIGIYVNSCLLYPDLSPKPISAANSGRTWTGWRLPINCHIVPHLLHERQWRSRLSLNRHDTNEHLCMQRKSACTAIPAIIMTYSGGRSGNVILSTIVSLPLSVCPSSPVPSPTSSSCPGYLPFFLATNIHRHRQSHCCVLLTHVGITQKMLEDIWQHFL